VEHLQLALGLRQLVVGVDHVHRQPHRAALVGDGAADRVTDPPAPVGREAEALAVVEAVDRLHQADVALLDQVLQRHATVVEAAGDRHHEAQVGLHERVLGVAQVAARRCAPLEVGLEGAAALARHVDREAQPLALAGVELLEVGEQDVGDDAVDVDLGHALDQRGAGQRRSPACARGSRAHAGCARRRAGPRPRPRHVLALELLLDEIGDRLAERRVGAQRGPVLRRSVAMRVATRQLLLGAHHAEAGHLAEVHAEEVRRLVAAGGPQRVGFIAGLVLGLGGPLDPGRRGRRRVTVAAQRWRDHARRTGASKPGGRSTGYFAACHDEPRSFRWAPT
jgi:hypothetical protein